MTEHTTCPTCGTVCRVVGDTTLHYQPVDEWHQGPVEAPLEISWETLAATEGERDEALEQVEQLRAENRLLLVLVAYKLGKFPAPMLRNVAPWVGMELHYNPDTPSAYLLDSRAVEAEVERVLRDYARRGRTLVEGKRDE